MARRSQANVYDAGRVSMQFDESITSQIEAFKGDFVEKVLRPAVFKGATVLYDEIKLRVPSDSGSLKNAIYRWKQDSETHIENNGQVIYYIGVNKRKAPHWHWIEHGYYQIYAKFFDEDSGEWKSSNALLPAPKFIPAQPYIRPAYDAKINAANAAVLKEMQEILSKKSKSWFFWG